MLVPLSDAAELDKLLLDTPGFAQLPVADRLRYQMAAELDTIVVDAFTHCKLDQPSQDVLSGMIAGYFSQRQIPPEALAMVLDRLPELVCGSPARKPSEIANLASCWLGFLSYQVLPEVSLESAVKRLLETAVQRGPEVLRAVRGYMPQPLRAQAGVEADVPDAAPIAVPVEPLWWSSLAVFASADPVCCDTYSAEQRRVRLFDRPFMNGQPFVPMQMPGVYALLNSPWEQNISGMIERDPSESRAKAVLAAKLRNLFDDNPSRTVIYDLLVSTGVMPCPDPETKALADRRAATIGTTTQDDPAIAFYLFLHRLANSEPLDQALAALQGLQEFPLPTRHRLMTAVGVAEEFLRRFSGAHDALMAQLVPDPPVKPKAPEAPEAPTALTAYDRLQLYQDAWTTGTPECLALAREILFMFVDTKCPSPEFTENLAITILVQTGKFEGFLADLKTRMAEAGASETDVQRALYRVHLNRTVHNKGEMIPYARRLLDLDPTDSAAAMDVLVAATRNEDRPLVLKCLQVLCRQSRQLLCGALAYHPLNDDMSEAGPVQLFTGPQASELADALLGIPLAPPEFRAHRHGGSICLTNQRLPPLRRRLWMPSPANSGSWRRPMTTRRSRRSGMRPRISSPKSRQTSNHVS